jgi:hypothetical protein
VPLVPFTNADFPAGLELGETNGVSIGDFDGDGWADIFAADSALLWRNVAGQTWELAADLDDVLPSSSLRYGSSFGDYDGDGLPDLAIEPRDVAPGDTCFHLLRNEGNATFVDVATNPQVLVQPCGTNAETACWGDVDDDGFLDLFLPAYPPWGPLPGPGNYFFHNLGPTGPGGIFHFAETSAGSGLDNPPETSRPEGAQFADVDGDGDIDLFSNGTLYRNDSVPGTVQFVPMSVLGSGIQFATAAEEGLAFFDHDLDGDLDLAVAYNLGATLWENAGDGTFDHAGPDLIESPYYAQPLGLSAADWDNDGDIDFTTREVFRRNLMIEQGAPGFAVASHLIAPEHITSATPAWGDFDHDGDLDCALGNWFDVGHLYENTTYGPDTPHDERRYLRVRIVRDSPDVHRGLETEYGAIAEITIIGDDSGHRYRKHTASSAGYLNQDEYVLTFAIPAGVGPDVFLDLSVDFPRSLGNWRVDRFVNPLLGSIRLEDLVGREISVFRSGRVDFSECSSVPLPAAPSHVVTAGGGLLPTDPGSPLPGLVDVPADTYVGVAFRTEPDAPSRLKEIVLDGHLAPSTSCGTHAANVWLWDVTEPATPLLAATLARGTGNNRRTHFPTDLVLEPARAYRLVAHVDRFRNAPITGPATVAGITLLGGLAFTNPVPCDGAAPSGASLLGSTFAMTVRYGIGPDRLWTDLGGAHGDGPTTPALSGASDLQPGSPFILHLTHVEPGAPVWWIVGLQRLCQPFGGGMLVPAPDLVLGPLISDANGELEIDTSWPGGFPPGTTLYVQSWIAGLPGWESSNALSITTPYAASP